MWRDRTYCLGSIRRAVDVSVGVGCDDKAEMEFGGKTGAFENTEPGVQRILDRIGYVHCYQDCLSVLGDYWSELIDSGFVNERQSASVMIFP